MTNFYLSLPWPYSVSDMSCSPLLRPAHLGSYFQSVFGLLHSSSNSDKMALSEEIRDSSNSTNDGIWSVFSWDQRDIAADDLPMMNSVAWPLGEFSKTPS